MSGLLAGRVVVVAGGGRGMGESCSLLAAQEGAAVLVVDKVIERAERVCDAIKSAGGVAAPLLVDLRRDEDLLKIITAAIEFGPIDVLINIAGGMRADGSWKRLADNTVDDWDFVFRQNVRWVRLLSVMVAEHMRQLERGGSFVSIGSMSGVFGAANHAAYGAAKAALIHLTMSLALEYGRYGMRFNTVSPGSIRTPAVAGMITPEQMRRDEQTTPVGRAGTPVDIANAVIFLASDRASFITAQNLVVDGGAGARFPLPSPGAHPSESLT